MSTRPRNAARAGSARPAAGAPRGGTRSAPVSRPPAQPARQQPAFDALDDDDEMALDDSSPNLLGDGEFGGGGSASEDEPSQNFMEQYQQAIAAAVLANDRKQREQSEMDLRSWRRTITNTHKEADALIAEGFAKMDTTIASMLADSAEADSGPRLDLDAVGDGLERRLRALYKIEDDLRTEAKYCGLSAKEKLGGSLKERRKSFAKTRRKVTAKAKEMDKDEKKHERLKAGAAKSMAHDFAALRR